MNADTLYSRAQTARVTGENVGLQLAHGQPGRRLDSSKQDRLTIDGNGLPASSWM